MLILIVEGLTLHLYYKWHSAPQQPASANIFSSILNFFTSSSLLLHPSNLSSFPSQSSQSAGRRGWVLQITVCHGVDPWGRAHGRRRPASHRFQQTSRQSELSFTSADRHVRDRHSKERPPCWKCFGMWSKEKRCSISNLTILISEHLNSAYTYYGPVGAEPGF